MFTINDLAKAFASGKEQFEQCLSCGSTLKYKEREQYCFDGKAAEAVNTLAQSDNASYMEYLIKEKKMAGKIKLIYLDPPFFSNAKYEASVQIKSETSGKSKVYKTPAYDDCWSDGMSEYITMLTVRLYLMKELLAEDGLIWVHLDWHGVHYVKIVMDQIFGEGNIINEVIWTYKSGGSNKKSFARKHDNLLLYSKSQEYDFHPLKEKSYNRGLKPYRFKGVEEFRDEIGWHTMVNMKDVWSIDMVGRTSGERTGYATQKPEKLLERIIESCSGEGDICADFFAGSGTLACVAHKLNRKWIICDRGNQAISDQIFRLTRQGSSFNVVVEEDENIDSSKGTLCWKAEGDTVSIYEYSMDKQLIPIREVNEVMDYIRQDSLSLIKLWSIDFSYDGVTHRSDGVFSKGERTVICPAGVAANHISIIGYDVFGNRFEGGRK